jgi:hypothetical protein
MNRDSRFPTVLSQGAGKALASRNMILPPTLILNSCVGMFFHNLTLLFENQITAMPGF